MTFKVLLTDRSIKDYEPYTFEREAIEAAGGELILANCRTEAELIAAGRAADALINQGAPITRRVLEGLSRCRLVVRYAIGVENIDVEAATEHGIVVANVADYCIEEVSDHCVGLLLGCARRLFEYHHAVRRGEWTYATTRPIHRLNCQTVGFVGFGTIARRVAARLRAFGPSLVAFDPYISEETAAAHGVKLASLDSVLSRADYVSVHLPLTVETERLLGGREFGLMKRSAYLINTSRGAVLDEAALIDALQQGAIAGAALDVLAKEPPDPDSPLLHLENVIITPHAASVSVESRQAARQGVCDAVIAVLRGRWPRFVVNRGVSPRFPVVV